MIFNSDFLFIVTSMVSAWLSATVFLHFASKIISEHSNFVKDQPDSTYEDEFMNEIVPNYVFEFILYGFIPCVLLLETNYWFAIATTLVYSYFGINELLYVPLACILIKATFPPYIATCIAISTMYTSNPILIVGIIVLGLLKYIGVLDPINFTKSEFPGITLWYRVHTGPYKNVGTTISGFMKDLTEAGLRNQIENFGGMLYS